MPRSWFTQYWLLFIFRRLKINHVSHEFILNSALSRTPWMDGNSPCYFLAYMKTLHCYVGILVEGNRVAGEGSQSEPLSAPHFRCSPRPNTQPKHGYFPQPQTGLNSAGMTALPPPPRAGCPSTLERNQQETLCVQMYSGCENNGYPWGKKFFLLVVIFRRREQNLKLNFTCLVPKLTPSCFT